MCRPLRRPLTSRVVEFTRKSRTPGGLALLLGVLVLAAAWMGRANCLHTYRDSNGTLQLDWRHFRQYRDFCYSDVIALYSAERLNEPGTFPYRTRLRAGADNQARYMEYPVGTGVMQWVNARLAHWVQRFARVAGIASTMTVVVYFDITALELAASWLFVIWAVSRICRGRAAPAVLAAVSPLVLVQLYTNFDAWAVALATGGLLAWGRSRPLLAGVLLGLGGATKFYPLLLLVPLVLIGLRRRNLRPSIQCASAAATVWIVANAPIAILFPSGWHEFFRLNTTRGADLDSVYNLLAHAFHWGGFDGAVAPGREPILLNIFSGDSFLILCVCLAMVVLGAQRQAHVAEMSVLIVAGFLLVNKVWSPQYSLWLVPLVVISSRRTLLVCAWMLIDAFVWVPRMLAYLGTSHGGLPDRYFFAAVGVRDVMVVVICATVIWDIARVGDASGADRGTDPCGGVYADWSGLRQLRHGLRASPSDPATR